MDRRCTEDEVDLRFPCTHLCTAVGKSTFLRILERASPSYNVVSEPLTRWQNVTDDEVRSVAMQHPGVTVIRYFSDFVPTSCRVGFWVGLWLGYGLMI